MADLPAPSVWVESHLPEAVGRRRALDLACGSGRHALLMASAGFEVLAVDRNDEALKLLAARWARLSEAHAGAGSVTTQCLELEGETWPLPVERYGQWDLIVVTNYLYRPYLAQLPAMLARGGRLVYETFAAGNAVYGRPSNPEFLLEPGELLEFARQHGLDVLGFAQGYVTHPKPAITQRICVCNRHTAPVEVR